MSTSSSASIGSGGKPQGLAVSAILPGLFTGSTQSQLIATQQVPEQKPQSSEFLERGRERLKSERGQWIIGEIGVRIEATWGSRLSGGCLNELQCIALCELLWSWNDAEILWCLDDMAKRLEYSPVERDWRETRLQVPVGLRSSLGDPLHHAGEASCDSDVALNDVDRENERHYAEVEKVCPGWYRSSTLMMVKRCQSGLPFWQSVRVTLADAKEKGLPAWELLRLEKMMKDSQARYLLRVAKG